MTEPGRHIRIPLEDLADEARRQTFLAVVDRSIDSFKEAAMS